MAVYLSVGDLVKFRTSKPGRIVAIKHSFAVVNFDYVILQIPIQFLEPVPSQPTLKEPLPTNGYTRKFDMQLFLDFSPEIDLHGFRVAHALQRLDSWLGEAILAGHTYLKIIHGKGHGILRKNIYTYLLKDTRVKKIIQDHPWPGGDGLTCVELYPPSA